MMLEEVSNGRPVILADLENYFDQLLIFLSCRIKYFLVPVSSVHVQIKQ